MIQNEFQWNLSVESFSTKGGMQSKKTNAWKTLFPLEKLKILDPHQGKFTYVVWVLIWLKCDLGPGNILMNACGLVTTETWLSDSLRIFQVQPECLRRPARSGGLQRREQDQGGATPTSGPDTFHGQSSDTLWILSIKIFYLTLEKNDKSNQIV